MCDQDITNSKKRISILFVGSFKGSENGGVRGGVQFECLSLLSGPVSVGFDWLKVDSTMESIPPPSFFRRAWLALKRLIQFIRILVMKRPSCCLIYTSAGESFFEKGLMALIAEAAGTPVLLRPISGYIIATYRRSAIGAWYIRFVVRNVSCIACQGSRWREFFVAVGGISRLRVPIVYNPVGVDNFNFARSLGGIKSDGIIDVLIVGWVDRNKGILDAIRVFARYRADLLRVRLTICGDGAAMKESRDLVIELGLSEQVLFAGWVKGEEKLKYFSRSDIFLLLSYREGLPNALIEAMAFGCAPVATSVGAIPDLIEDGVSGYLCEPGDIDGIGLNLVKLVRSEQIRFEMGRAARASVVSKLSMDVVAKQWNSVIQATAKS